MMPLRHFPYPIRLGVDICKISRIQRFLDYPYKFQKLLQRTLTPREVKYLRLRHGVPTASNHGLGEGLRREQANFVAGRWACKEAVIKAAKPRKLQLRDVEVWPDEHKELYAIIVDKANNYSSEDYDFKARSNETLKEELATLPKVQDFSSDGFIVGDDLTWVVLPHRNTNGRVARLSLAHDGEYAVACALDVNDEARKTLQPSAI